MFPRLPVALHDIRSSDADGDTELFIVEGDSASKSVARVRDDHFQAVLPMQGKPLNAWKSSAASVARYELYQKLIDALGAGWGSSFDLAGLRYQRVLLLFDPDADGIHCGALMLLFFHRWMRELVDSGRLMVVRAPLYRIWSAKSDHNSATERIYAYSDQHFHKIREQLVAKNIPFQSQRFRGLASLSADCLLETCIDPATRGARVLTTEDAEDAIRVFGGSVSR